MQCVVSIISDFNSFVFQLMSISKKYTDYGDNLSSETTIRSVIDIDTLLQTYAYIHIHFYALYCVCMFASVQNSFYPLKNLRPKIVVSYRKKGEKKHVSKKRVSKYDVLFQNCIALSSKMSSNGACLYEEGGIEGGHIPSYLLPYVRLRFHVYMFIPEN